MGKKSCIFDLIGERGGPAPEVKTRSTNVEKSRLSGLSIFPGMVFAHIIRSMRVLWCFELEQQNLSGRRKRIDRKIGNAGSDE